MASASFRLDVCPLIPAVDQHLVHDAKLLGLGHLTALYRSRYYVVRGKLDAAAAERLGKALLCDPVVERLLLAPPPHAGRRVIEVQRKTGVMDPIEASIIKGAKDLGLQVEQVRVGTRVEVAGATDADLQALAWKVLANQAIEEAVIDPADAVRLRDPAGVDTHKRTEVRLRDLDDAALMKLSKDGTLSLTIEEMHAVQEHFRGLKREPTDVELESIAQTWSEHCVHKTLKGIVAYTGPVGEDGPVQSRVIDNLLKQTIAKATHELAKPWCWSVFKDNSGVIEFEGDLGVCIKVETHNRPSAIEPYGGANTGLGGVIRDIVGTGLGAKPIFNTDVFCFGEPDTDAASLPPGTIHPRRLMKGVISGVRDYGNRMGIPTVNGAVRFDPRYVGNPLVYCGTGGLIERRYVEKASEIGDAIVVIGGRTGRDGIHGATFSSVELSDKSEKISSGAVQIGNAIEEKRCMDVVLQCRDAGCFTALTDCGAGGLSSACGEMASEHGAVIHLDRAPLKYAGLSYTEIWISESQERMVASVPKSKLKECLAICAAEGVEAIELGEVSGQGKLVLKWHGTVVADLDMGFLFDGVPRYHRPATFAPKAETAAVFARPADAAATLCDLLARPNLASKEWIIRQYDHEVQAGSIIKPLVGVAHDGPSDAAVVAPVPGKDRGVAVACGFNPSYADHDAWRGAASGIEEALRNLVCVGAPIDKVAILDNFSWSKCTDPEVFGALVRACEACYELSKYYGAPFISGKDSLSNEFTFGGKVIRIPHTLLITAMAVVPDVKRSISMDLKRAGDRLILAGLTRDELGNSELLAMLGGSGGSTPRVDLKLSKPVLSGCAAAIAAGCVNAAHDCSEGGLAAAVAEMAFSGGLGARIDLSAVPREGVDDPFVALFSESQSRIVLSVPADQVDAARRHLTAVPHAVIGEVTAAPELAVCGLGLGFTVANDRLKAAWQRLSQRMGG
ncbi:MAG TPA: phosphoribosylformylglycinamidine synthase subunit PurL [Planctomycetes bacterium]|nr:phosphoribosylformylglycinamidine synthase subunit PurL [Planctomycetota bacterium]